MASDALAAIQAYVRHLQPADLHKSNTNPS